MKFLQNKQLRGTVLVLIAAMLWGFLGNAVQFLFHYRNVTPEWISMIRLFVAGALILTYTYCKQGKKIFAIWKSRIDVIRLLIYSIFGILAVQFTYFVAIDKSNAATATVIQYVGPAMVLAYISLRNLTMPTKWEIAAICAAIAGVFLIATHGNIHELALSREALIWGLLSALAFAVYAIQPLKLLQNRDVFVVVGWGMLIACFTVTLIYRPWTMSPPEWDFIMVLLLAFSILFGAMAGYLCFMAGLKLVGATKASLYSCLEPVAAAVFGVLWLKTQLVIIDYLGFVLIIGAVVLICLQKDKNAAVVLVKEAGEE